MGTVAASIAIFLIALAAALAFLFFALKWVSKNEDQTRVALSKVGLQPLDPIVPIDPSTTAHPVAPPLTPSATAPIVQAQSIPLPSPSVVFSPALLSLTGQRFDLPEGVSTVSRDSGEICLIGEQTVSRQHAQLIRQGSTVTVRDLASTNGTFVNGVRIQADSGLSDGDTVQFGAVMLRVQM